jgi:hypothetical protein
VEDGVAALKAGETTTAQQFFSEAAEEASGDRAASLHLAAGSAASKAQDWSVAVDSFSSALSAEDAEIQQQAHYALATSLFYLGAKKEKAEKMKAWKGAIEHFEASLELQPEDQASADNLQSVRKQLAELLSEEKKEEKSQEKEQQKDQDEEKKKEEDKESEEPEKPDDQGQDDESEKKDPQKKNQDDSNSGENSDDSKDAPSDENKGDDNEGNPSDDNNDESQADEPKEDESGQDPQSDQSKPGDEKSDQQKEQENSEEGQQGGSNKSQTENANLKEDPNAPENETPRERARRLLKQYSDFGGKAPRRIRRPYNRSPHDW